MNNKPKKKHHYIPKFYLKGFTYPDPDDPDGKLCVYSKDKEHYSEVLCGVSLDAIAFEKHGYTVILSDGTMDSEIIENIFAEKESKTAPLLKKIISGQKLTDNEFSTFVSDFLAIMAVRTPKGRMMIRDKIDVILKEIDSKAIDESSFREYINNRKNQGYNIKFSEENMEKERLKYIDIYKCYKSNSREIFEWALILSGMHEVINKDLMKMEWQICGPVKKYKFLTSDFPVIYTNEKEYATSFLMPVKAI